MYFMKIKKAVSRHSNPFGLPMPVHRFYFYIDKLYSRFTVRHPRKTPGRLTPASLQGTVPLSFPHEHLYTVFVVNHHI